MMSYKVEFEINIIIILEMEKVIIKWWKPVTFFFFFFGHTTWHAELPWPGIEPVSPAVKAWSLNHWTAREVQPFISELVYMQENYLKINKQKLIKEQ